MAVLAYQPTFQISLIADDFPQIQMSRTIGGSGGIAGFWTAPNERWRLTFFVITYWVDRIAGLNPNAFHGVQLAFHVLCCWLVYGLGTWPMVGRRMALIAACFFAVYEGHQEAVMWYSGFMETLVFLFGTAAVVCFIQWLQANSPVKGWSYYGLALICLILAMFSKESAYIFPALMALPLADLAGSSRKRFGLLPFVLMAIAYVAWIASARTGNPRFGDGSFAITPHFARVLLESLGRLLFVWGLLAIAVLAILRRRDYLALTVYAFLWMLLGLIPYSFLTYMNRVPSRHTYVASAGLAILVAAALVAIWERLGGRAVLAIAAVILMANVAILWRKKAEQYRARALPTDMLINAVRRSEGPIHIRCFPYIPLVAESAAREFGGTIDFEKQSSFRASRCLDFWYKDGMGNVREVFVPPARLP